MTHLGPRLAALSISAAAPAALLLPVHAPAAVASRANLPTPAPTPSSRAVAPTTGEPEFLNVRINQIDQSDGVRAIRLPTLGLAVPTEALDAWRLRVPATVPLVIEGRDHHLLDTVAGLGWKIDVATQSLWLQAPAEAFVPNRFDVVDRAASAITPSGAGGYVNYDLNWQQDAGARGARASRQGNALIEVGAFNAGGNGRASGLWRDGNAITHLGSDHRPAFIRLDTTWNIDIPQRLQSLRIGDAIGQPGAWGQSVRYGGLQWASNFGMQPGLARFPLPSLHGEAALPSVVDLYINNVHQLQGQLPPGPFDLPNVPVVTGPGSIRMVVRDLLGREQVVTQPYYVSPALLRPGLHEFAVDAGWLRQGYGTSSSRYGQALLSGTSRLGVTPRFTREWRAELQSRRQTLGAGGSWLIGELGTFNGIAAASRGPHGLGASVGAAIDRQALDWSFNLQARWSSAQFSQLGRGTAASPATRLQLTAGLGTSVGSGALSLSLLHQAAWGGEQPLTALSFNFSHSLGSFGYLGIYATRNTGAVDGYVMGINLIHQWDRQTNVSAGVTASAVSVDARSGGAAAAAPQRMQATLQAQRNPSTDAGVGYQLLTESGDKSRISGEASWQTEVASVNLAVARSSGAGAVRAGLSGGVALMPEGAFPARRIDGSFAVVKVGDFEGVRVLRDNLVVARTDAKGRALVTGLRNHEANRIGLDAADLPMDAEVDHLHMVVTPAARSGVTAVFAVRRTRAATLRLVTPDGQAVPPGSSVKIEGAARQYPVGYHGMVFVVGLTERTRIVADWPEHRCSAELVLTHAENDLPDLGRVVCRTTAS